MLSIRNLCQVTHTYPSPHPQGFEVVPTLAHLPDRLMTVRPFAIALLPCLGLNRMHRHVFRLFIPFLVFAASRVRRHVTYGGTECPLVYGDRCGNSPSATNLIWHQVGLYSSLCLVFFSHGQVDRPFCSCAFKTNQIALYCSIFCSFQTTFAKNIELT